MEWIYTDKSLPFAYETGDWDGKRSDLVIAQDDKHNTYVALIYQGRLDGSEFCDWYDSRDFDIKEKIIRWMPIPA